MWKERFGPRWITQFGKRMHLYKLRTKRFKQLLFLAQFPLSLVETGIVPILPVIKVILPIPSLRSFQESHFGDLIFKDLGTWTVLAVNRCVYWLHIDDPGIG